ncbi:regulatory protein RecX [Eggerthella timonensis]|uniref:regulatory protein RecX n=1 Tax=Eggerthella timonensis TaxID=1871008 RepID=UPI000C78A6AE|nr:regulatory protein RecX [Eggerthella timonensis]
MPESPSDLRARLRAEIAAIEQGKAPAADAAKPSRSREASDGPHARDAARGASGNHPDGPCARVKGLRFEPEEALDGADGARFADPEAAFRKIERLCLVREQASEQLRRRLARDGFEPEAVEAALSRALACGLVDDARFADVLVRSRLAQGRGKRGIAAELEGLGIDADGVDALAERDGDDAGEVERALALLDRKPPRAKNRRDAAYRRLAQKGFSSSVSSTAARLWCEAHPVEG